MGHILLAGPEIAHYHLHVRLARALTARGHRVTVLAASAETFEFYSAQGFAAWCLRAAAPNLDPQVPLDDFALQDLRLAGQTGAPEGGRRSRRAARALGRLLEPMRRMLGADAPDLLLVHQGRTGFHRLLHYAARQSGSRILHTGHGLLPGTMQWDDEGIDGDAAASRRTAVDYMRFEPDRDFLSATLSAWLVGLQPPPLVHAQARPPALGPRLGRCAGRLLRGDPRGGCRALTAWRAALEEPWEAGGPGLAPPKPPYVAVLLQPRDCPRVMLDAPGGTRPLDLARAAVEAAEQLDGRVPVVAVLPDEVGPPPRRDVDALRRYGVIVRPSTSAGPVLMTALAAVTINHPLGIGALLCGTPVLHTGRTPYGIEGVSVRTTLDGLAMDLRRALALEDESVRERFLTRYLSEDHVWCSPDRPDHNGINGLVAGIEERMRKPVPVATKRGGYRVGPAWPLQPRG